MARSVLAFALLLLALPAERADACIHLGEAYGDGTVRQSGQEGVIVFKDGIEHLVLGIDLRLEDAGDKLAWVVPVPNVPEHYETLDAGLFQELHRWVRLEETNQLRVADAEASMGGDPFRVLPATEVGPYTIQPIQGKGPSAAASLNAWMLANGFQVLPDETLRYYVERGWTFLTVRVTPKATGFSAREKLPPLAMRFRSEHAVYPLKLSTHMGRYAVRLYMITADELDDEAFAGAIERGFSVAGDERGRGRLGSVGYSARHRSFAPTDAPTSLQTLLSLAELGNEETLHMRVLYQRRLRGSTVAEWDEDLAVPPFADAADATASAAWEDEEANDVADVEAPSPETPPEALPEDPGHVTAAGHEGSTSSCACRASGGGDVGVFFVVMLGVGFLTRRR